MNGTIDNKEATLKRNKIHERILIALNAFDSEGNPLPNASISKGKTTKFLGKYGLILVSIAAIGELIFSSLSYKQQDTLDKLYIFLEVTTITVGLLFLIGWFIATVIQAIREK